jgi:hypothetical protein
MVKFVHGPNKKRTTRMSIVGIINMQQRMLGVVFKGYIVNMYGFYNVIGILQHKKNFFFFHYPNSLSF